MNPEIPKMGTPYWLEQIAENPAIAKVDTFPLKNIIQSSCFYPASGVSGYAVKNFSGNVVSFIHADLSYNKTEFLNSLNERNSFRGYTSILQREIKKDEIVPSNFRPILFPDRNGNDKWIEAAYDLFKEFPPFAHWSIWKRNDGYDDNHGAPVFSLLHIRSDATVTYQGLYYYHHTKPKILCLYNPGMLCGGWTYLDEQDHFFHKVVSSNEYGMPEYLSINRPWREYSNQQLGDSVYKLRDKK